MRKTITVATIALLGIGALTGCTHSISDPAPTRAASVSAHLKAHPNDVPAYVDTSQRPFIGDGTGAESIAFTPATGTKSISYFISCAFPSAYSFEVFSGKTSVQKGSGGDCSGVNLSAYGTEVDAAKKPTSITVKVKDGDAFEVTAYLSGDSISNG
ncbi:hypothetical protein [Frondihabitans sucicola]|nr:hypothetical protein [Frondihabitans sucicola]